MFKKALLTAAAICSALLPLTGCGNPSTAGNVPGSTPLSITTTSLPSGTTSTAYSATIAATGGTSPYTFSFVSGVLPGGLTLARTGSLTGTPTGAGTYTFTVAAVDNASTRATATFTIPVIAPLTITTTTLAGGTVGTPYSATVAATGGTTPYAYTVASGSLPAGLTLNAATGAITGTPTASGTSAFSIKVTDKGALTATQAYSVAIAALPAITLSPATLPGGTLKTAYATTALSATNGTSPYSYAVTAGALPGGLTLSPAGVLAGTPSASGTFNFTVTATDATSRTGSAAYTVVIASGPTITLTPATLPAAAVSSPFTATFGAAGGTAPYSYSVATGGTLTPGLSLSAGGLLSGTPTTAGTYSFSVTATDANTFTGTQAYTLTVNTAGSIITLTSNNLGALVNTAYTYKLPLAGGTGTYTVTKSSGSYPAGVSLSSSGVFSGTPTATGTSTFTIHVTDTSSPQLSQDFTITLNVVDATVAVDATTTLATVPSIFYGLHTAVYDNQLSDYSAIATRMASAGVTMLRFPGGGLSDVYHWAQHSVTPYEASYPATCNDLAVPYVSPNSHFGTFAKLLQATGAGGIVTVNYGNSVADANASRTTGYGGTGIAYSYCSNPNKPGQPQEAAAWVAYANGSTTNTLNIGKDDAGFDWKTVSFWATLRSSAPLSTDDGYNFLRINHPDPIGIRYWEVGNELYYNGWSNNQNAETDTHAPYTYTKGYVYQGYESRAGVSALSPTAYGVNAVSFINAMKAVDSTIKVGLTYDAPGATDPINASYNFDLTTSVCTHGAFDFVIIHYYPGSYFGGSKPQELLSLPQYDLPKQIYGDASDPTHPGIRPLLNASCSNASSIQYMMTETSPNQSLAPGFPPPVIGLFVINEAMMALQVGYQNYDWLELHSSTSQTNYMQNTFLDSSETPGPSYYGFQLAHQMAAPGDTQVRASTANTSSTGFIVSYATVKADGTKGIILMNADPTLPETVQVTVSGASLGSTATQYTYGINTTQNNNTLTQSTFAVPGQSFPVTVPPYTAVELIIQ